MFNSWFSNDMFWLCQCLHHAHNLDKLQHIHISSAKIYGGSLLQKKIGYITHNDIQIHRDSMGP